MMLGMTDVHWLFEKRYFLCKVCLWKIELKKLANSEIFAMSEITPEDFADSEPGAKFSVFPKTVTSSQGSSLIIGGCIHNLLRNKNPL
jgi:hypothetical protein